jgi:hypothetical protein
LALPTSSSLNSLSSDSTAFVSAGYLTMALIVWLDRPSSWLGENECERAGTVKDFSRSCKHRSPLQWHEYELDLLGRLTRDMAEFAKAGPKKMMNPLVTDAVASVEAPEWIGSLGVAS